MIEYIKQPYMSPETDTGGSLDDSGVNTNVDNAAPAADTIMQENEQMARDLGYNSYNEFRSTVSQYKANQQREQFINRYGIEPETAKPLYDEFKRSDPDYIRLQQTENNLVKNSAATELAEAFPHLSIKSWADVEKLPKYEQIKAGVLKGNDLVSAYNLAHMTEISNRMHPTAKVTQGANSKSNKPSDADVRNVNVPASTMSYYHSFFPKWTDSQIKQHYAKTAKK